MRLRSYRVCEHVCPIRCVLVICLDEERHERCSIDIQTLIVPKEEAPGIGCYRHIEGRRGDTYLVTEARAMVGRRGPRVCAVGTNRYLGRIGRFRDNGRPSPEENVMTETNPSWRRARR